MIPELDVTIRGAVLMSDAVVCDGFRYESPYRVQSHVHLDHMEDFAPSKQFQTIYASRATRDLLVAEHNADLGYRINFVGIPFGEWSTLDGVGRLQLLSSNHMLGAAQVALETNDGVRLGYSGDFQWPLEEVINVDALVVDSTYGAPRKLREYSQADAEGEFLGLVMKLLRQGPVYLKGHRGTTQRALQILAGNIGAPLVASSRFCEEVEIYRKYGCVVDDVLPSNSENGREACKTDRFIRIYSQNDRFPVEGRRSTIVLSAFMSDPKNPVRDWGGGSYSVALTDHADFCGTLEYIRATGAREVVTDNTRGHGVELAIEIRARLGIKAHPSSNRSTSEWGG